MCSACLNIPKLESFRKRILPRSEKTSQKTNKQDTTSIGNEYLTSKEMVKKLKEQKEKLDHMTRIAKFVAINLGGPEIHSIYWWHNQHHVDISGGIRERNFKKLVPLSKEAMANISSSSVPVLAAEDETAIIGHVTYYQDQDELLGFCGVNGQHHTCLDHFAVKVEDGEKGFTNIVNAFKECKIGTFGKAILLNPLHPNLPRIAVLVMPTCNKVDHHVVHQQWKEVKRLYAQELKNIVGPLIGKSSDGDSRRRKIMLQLATADVDKRFRPITRDLGFILILQKAGHRQ